METAVWMISWLTPLMNLCHRHHRGWAAGSSLLCCPSLSQRQIGTGTLWVISQWVGLFSANEIDVAWLSKLPLRPVARPLGGRYMEKASMRRTTVPPAQSLVKRSLSVLCRLRRRGGERCSLHRCRCSAYRTDRRNTGLGKKERNFPLRLSASWTLQELTFTPCFTYSDWLNLDSSTGAEDYSKPHLYQKKLRLRGFQNQPKATAGKYQSWALYPGWLAPKLSHHHFLTISWFWQSSPCGTCMRCINTPPHTPHCRLQLCFHWEGRVHNPWDRAVHENRCPGSCRLWRNCGNLGKSPGPCGPRFVTEGCGHCNLGLCPARWFTSPRTALW